MVTMFFIYGTIIIANLITAWIVVNQKHAETEIILAKQRIEEITGSSEVSKEIPKGEKEIVFDFLTKEAYSHGGLQTGKLGQTPLESTPKICVTNPSCPPANLKGKGNTDLPSVCSNYWSPIIALSLCLNHLVLSTFRQCRSAIPKRSAKPIASIHHIVEYPSLT